MKIPVTCDNCGKSYNIPDRYAGKKVKCPQCEGPISVPSDDPEPGEITPDRPAPSSKRGRRKTSARRDDRAPRRRGRGLLLFILLMLLAGGGAYYYWFYMRPSPTPPAAERPSPLALVPATCTAYGGLNVERLLSAKVITDNQEEIDAAWREEILPDLEAKASPNSQALIQELKESGPLAGLRRRVARVVMGVDASRAAAGGPGSEKMPGILMVETRMPAEQAMDDLITLSEAEATEATLPGGRKAYRGEAEGQPLMATAIADRLVAFGDVPLVQASAALADGTGVGSVADDTNLMALSDGERENILWIAWKIGEAERKLMSQGGPSGLPVSPADLTAVLLTLDYASPKGLTLRVKARMTSAEAAESARTALMTSVAPMAGMFLGITDKELTGGVSGQTLVITLQLSDQRLEELGKMGAAAAQGAAQGTAVPGTPGPPPDLTAIRGTIPDTPAAGTVNGKPFTVEDAQLRDGILTLRQGRDFFMDAGVMIFTFLREQDRIEGRELTVGPETFNPPHVHIQWMPEGASVPETRIIMDDYTMLLAFEKREGDRLDGRIHLDLPESTGTAIQGTFLARLR